MNELAVAAGELVVLGFGRVIERLDRHSSQPDYPIGVPARLGGRAHHRAGLDRGGGRLDVVNPPHNADLAGRVGERVPNGGRVRLDRLDLADQDDLFIGNLVSRRALAESSHGSVG